MSAQAVISRIYGGLLDALFPPRCLACGTGGSFLCPSCLAACTRADGPRCPICWMPCAAGSVCGRCRARRPAVLETRSVYVFGGPLREALHALKYQGVSAVAPLLGGEMARLLRTWAPPLDTIVAVPLTGTRRRLRGYNQAQLLASELALQAELPPPAQALSRVHYAGPQARSPDEELRRRNVAGAFRADPRLVAGRNLLLIDDVTTSGATLNACARALLDGGAATVRALTLARED
ncbi:MAG TPA: ComF family protein [Dehalococcoidia bacterium]|nr:ComF family protein [Dehalococcoidia bacterium]